MGKGRRQNPPANRNATTTTVAVQRFAGPLPPPEILEQYNRIHPGFADRIITLAESQSQHRQGLERAVIQSNIKHEGRGQIFGFLIAVMVIAVSAVLMWHGKSLEGISGIVATLAALTGVFIYGRYRRDRELQQKRAQQQAQ